MAPLRFRAWNKSTAEMLYCPMGFCDSECGWIVLFRDVPEGSMSVSDALYPLQDFAVMQSTGLKNKNGVEIFEGDVVQIEGVQSDVFWDERDLRMAIRNWASKDLGYAVREGLDVEVKGNIYENPDLLPAA